MYKEYIVDDFVSRRIQGKYNFGFLGDLQSGKMVLVKTGGFSWEKAFKFALMYLKLLVEELEDDEVLRCIKDRFWDYGGLVLVEYSVEDFPYEERLLAMQSVFKEWVESF